MSIFTFLKDEDVFGDNKLSVIEKCGTRAPLTDFAILLGGFVYSNYQDDNKYGWWWTQSPKDGDARAVYEDGYNMWFDVNLRCGGIRPCLTVKYKNDYFKDNHGLYEFEYGEYPQTVASSEISSLLELLFQSNCLNCTGKTYVTDRISFEDCKSSFKPRPHFEYLYKGKKYIRFVNYMNYDVVTLSDGRKVYPSEVLWIMVEPIVWDFDKDDELAISKNILLSGIQFKHDRDYQGDFANTDIKKYIDNYFSNDISISSDIPLITWNYNYINFKDDDKSICKKKSI